MHCQISGTAQKSQSGSAGPAAMQGMPIPSQMTQEGGIVTKAEFWAGDGAADTREAVATAIMAKKEDFILKDVEW